MREHLYRALTTPAGIRLSTDDPTALIQKLSAARRESKDPSLKAITICVSRTNPEGEVWLVHQPEQEPPGGEET